ncbi:MAG: hypothetical protein QM655_14785 [Nocardioidaceae bacterium]
MSNDQPTARFTPAVGIRGARLNCVRLTAEMARRTEELVGFPYVATKTAPSTAQQLIGAYEHSVRTGEPYPVSSEFCDSTIYFEPVSNWEYRFWHDVSHRQLGLAFTLEDEWALGIYHLEQVAVFGLGPGTLEYDLFRCDIFGQLILLGVAHRFPFDQGRFALECVERGVEAGVLAELRRVAP